MKSKDIAVIVVVAVISVLISFFVSNKIFVTPSNRQQQVEVVQAISPTFDVPSTSYFNPNSIDPAPAQQTTGGNNQNPFNGTSQ